jgi:hypothetical protein
MFYMSEIDSGRRGGYALGSMKTVDREANIDGIYIERLRVLSLNSN